MLIRKMATKTIFAMSGTKGIDRSNAATTETDAASIMAVRINLIIIVILCSGVRLTLCSSGPEIDP